MGMTRDGLELLTALKRVCNEAGLFALEYMAGDLLVETEKAYARRMIDIGERLLTHAQSRNGFVLNGEPSQWRPNDDPCSTGQMGPSRRFSPSGSAHSDRTGEL